MPSPRDLAKRQNPSGFSAEPSHCGVCGLPMSACDCRQYREWGTDAVKAGSASADDRMATPAKEPAKVPPAAEAPAKVPPFPPPKKEE